MSWRFCYLFMIIGSVICSASINDIRSMTLRADNSYDVLCSDDSREVVTASNMRRDVVCPANSKSDRWVDPETKMIFQFVGRVDIYAARRLCSGLGPGWQIPREERIGRVLADRVMSAPQYLEKLLSSGSSGPYRAFWLNSGNSKRHDIFYKNQKDIIVITAFNSEKLPTLCVKEPFVAN